LLHSIFDQPEKKEVHAQFDRVLEALWEKLPAAAEHLEGAREEILAFSAFPKQIWRQIWSNTPNERLNKEIRRRTRVAGIVQDRRALRRPIGAVLAEQEDERIEGRRDINLGALPAAQEAGTEPASDTETKEVNATAPAAIAA